jgi:hypothetical protein
VTVPPCVQTCARGGTTEVTFSEIRATRLPFHWRCNVVVTYPPLGQGKKYLPSVGGLEGRQGEGASGHRGRASFTLSVLLGPSLAVGLALAGFSATWDAGSRHAPADSASTPTAFPLGTATSGPTLPPTAPAPAASPTPLATPPTRTPTPSAPSVPASAAPTAPPPTTIPPTVAPPTPSLPATPTPPTGTPSLPTLPPVPAPTLSLGVSSALPSLPPASTPTLPLGLP